MITNLYRVPDPDVADVYFHTMLNFLDKIRDLQDLVLNMLKLVQVKFQASFVSIEK